MIKLNYKNKYADKAVNNALRIPADKNSVLLYKLKPEYFTRNRKMGFKEVVYYSLMKTGLTSKMETINFNDYIDCDDISTTAVFNQREKYSADVFTEIMQTNTKELYNNYPELVKTYKGFLLTAIDGSEFEIPNTPRTRNIYRSDYLDKSPSSDVIRGHVSNMFDVLNSEILATEIGKECASERTQAEALLETVKSLELPYPIIRIMDRGYVSIRDIYWSIKRNDKFIIRLKNSDFDKEQRKTFAKDAELDIDLMSRRRPYKKSDPEFYHLAKKERTIKARIVQIPLENNTEYLITNLSKDEANIEELKELYNLRWKIELNFHALKESLKIETITSSKPELIRQDIMSQMVAFNILQAFIREEEATIDQAKYKYQMKINGNMAIGQIKKYLIQIAAESSMNKRYRISLKMRKQIRRFIEPIRKERKKKHERYTRKRSNKHGITKRKAF